MQLKYFGGSDTLISKSVLNSISAGFIAGTAASLLSSPLETVKIVSSTLVSQIQDAGALKTTFCIIKQRGLIGFYPAFSVTLARDAIGYAAFFSTFTFLHKN